MYKLKDRWKTTYVKDYIEFLVDFVFNLNPGNTWTHTRMHNVTTITPFAVGCKIAYIFETPCIDVTLFVTVVVVETDRQTPSQNYYTHRIADIGCIEMVKGQYFRNNMV